MIAGAVCPWRQASKQVGVLDEAAFRQVVGDNPRPNLVPE
jgi:hypothetical protein